MASIMQHLLHRGLTRTLVAGIALVLPRQLPGQTFGGAKPVSRAEMATIVSRLHSILPGERGAPEPGRARERLEKKAHLAGRQELSRRVEALGADQLELDLAIDRLKLGTPEWPEADAGRTRYRGLVSVALVETDDGSQPLAFLLPQAPPRSRYVAPTDATLFTLPKVSLGIDHRVTADLKLRLQLDYASDALNPGAGGVGLSEAYLLWDHPGRDFRVKLGGFALPFQRFEIDGPLRTPTRTVTPSALGTFLEAQRALGAELSVMTPRLLAGTDWKFGFFTGSDAALTPAGFQVGALSDAAGIQALSRSGMFDSSWGYYLDFGSAEKPGRRFKVRAGWLDNGGDDSALAPATPSAEVRGLIAGGSARSGKFRQTYQFARLDSRSRFGAGGRAGHDVAYGLWSWDFDERDSVSFRYDRWENEAETAPSTGSKGHAVTYSLARKLTKNSRLQFEFLAPRETGGGVSQLLDYWDEQAQLRYTVWF